MLRLLMLYACLVIMVVPAGAESKSEQSESGLLATEIPLRTDLGEKRIDGEQEATRAAAEALVITMQKRLDETGVSRRGDHGKPHACLKGTFAVLPSVLGTELAVGIARPTAAGEAPTYPVIARLSNAEQPDKPDRKSFSRGLALKLIDVGEGTTYLPEAQPNVQDLVMSSAPTFMMRTIKQYVKAFKARAFGGWHLIRFFATYPGVAIKARGLFQKVPPSVITQRYWGKLPYAWGDRAIKYSAWPCEAKPEQRPEGDAAKQENYQKAFIQEALRQGEICFQFGVQPRPKDEALQDAFPIEDGKVRWNEEIAPFIPIATVQFKGEDNLAFDSADNRKRCEELTFTPWNGLLVHQPLSNLSRARRVVYRASMEFRHKNYRK